MKKLKFLLLFGLIINIFGTYVLAQQKTFKPNNIKIRNVKSEYKQSEELRLQLVNNDNNSIYIQHLNGIRDFEIFIYDEVSRQWVTVERKQKFTYRTLSFEKLESGKEYIFEISMRSLWARTNIERKIKGNKYKAVIKYYAEIPKDWTKNIKIYLIESKMFKLV